MELADDSMSNKQYMGYCSAEVGSHQTTPDKRREERNVKSRFQVQLEEDGGGSTRQCWLEKWSVPCSLYSTGSDTA